MTTSDEDLRLELVKQAFNMPSVQTMMSRKSSITNAYVNAVIPFVVPSIKEIDEALKILAIDPANVRCVYCGDTASEWDHLRPLVMNRRPTGFISEIANLVPACGKCNQSKGNKNWRTWMLSNAKRSPTGRRLEGIPERIALLDTYEIWRKPMQIDFPSIIGGEDWEKYWSLCEHVITELQASQLVANEIRERIRAALSSTRVK